ncbi:DNA primase, large subunit [Auriculariales sp. MPI-PUGE-AT-0066]|nr:DNA primase, large subunit [Auriculariales sp. MPI-PUGE-AT-0066]
MFPGSRTTTNAAAAWGSASVNLQLNLKYPHRLNFYSDPPLDEITLEEFESCAIDRIRVLSEIESSLARNRSPEELKVVTEAQLRKYLPLEPDTAHKAFDLNNQRKRDHLGHFVLRLAFCRSEDLRRRFVNTELELFRVRYNSTAKEELEKFLASLDFAWERVGQSELDNLKEDLLTVHPTLAKSWGTGSWYKVPWISVPDLVARRKVLLKGGKAYVPSSEQSSIVLNEFKDRLIKSLDMTAKALPRLDEDDRILPILSHLSEGMLAGLQSDYGFTAPSENSTEIRADMIDELARSHFPLCMRNLHDNLRSEKHLKHSGRLQYGLFLKGLGLSLDEAIVFWRKSYRGGKVRDDEFEKSYKYNIRHNYGQEGKRADYPPYSCTRIIGGPTPGPQDSHGCPFRHFSKENLNTAVLSAYGSCGVTPQLLPELHRLVDAHHYHVACTRVFEVTHNVKSGEGIGGGDSVGHPNRYFERSRELELERAGPAATIKTDVKEEADPMVE